MKIQLDYKIDIEIQEGGKAKEKLSIFLREFTQKEKKENDVLRKRFEKIFKKAQKIGKKQNTLNEKTELYKLSNENLKALKSIEENEALEDELDDLMQELDEIGGGNQDEFAEKTAQARFETLVSGKDKEKLEVYAEIKGYQALLRDLDKAKVELEKKQSGE